MTVFRQKVRVCFGAILFLSLFFDVSARKAKENSRARSRIIRKANKKDDFLRALRKKSKVQTSVLRDKQSLKEKKWTVLVYAQACNNMNNVAHVNFSDMAKVGSDQDTNLLVQWYKERRGGFDRYRILKNNIALDEHVDSRVDGTKAPELIDSVRWAVTKYPAQHYCVILWDHGYGILDRSLFNVPERAILYNSYTRRYMNNQELEKAFKTIYTDVMKNKKIDIVGMDACMMGMFEVGCQIKDYARYFVASEEYEPMAGWNYRGFLSKFTQKYMSPVEFSKLLVQSYGAYHVRQRHWNTLSAVNLDHCDSAQENLDMLVLAIREYQRYNKQEINNLIKQARRNASVVDAYNYVDLYSFCQKLLAEVKRLGFNQKASHVLLKTRKALEEQLEKTKKHLGELFIVANTSRSASTQSKGSAIYLPMHSRIHHSYLRTEFAKNSLWVEFLESLK